MLESATKNIITIGTDQPHPHQDIMGSAHALSLFTSGVHLVCSNAAALPPFSSASSSVSGGVSSSPATAVVGQSRGPDASSPSSSFPRPAPSQSGSPTPAIILAGHTGAGSGSHGGMPSAPCNREFYRQTLAPDSASAVSPDVEAAKALLTLSGSPTVHTPSLPHLTSSSAPPFPDLKLPPSTSLTPILKRSCDDGNNNNSNNVVPSAIPSQFHPYLQQQLMLLSKHSSIGVATAGSSSGVATAGSSSGVATAGSSCSDVATVGGIRSDGSLLFSPSQPFQQFQKKNLGGKYFLMTEEVTRKVLEEHIRKINENNPGLTVALPLHQAGAADLAVNQPAAAPPPAKKAKRATAANQEDNKNNNNNNTENDNNNIMGADIESDTDIINNIPCKVCGANDRRNGFHFGVFTCEGCKSFFGRFKNREQDLVCSKGNYECVILVENRNNCKACRILKQVTVGMNRNHCQYGRRSDAFKQHTAMQERARNNGWALNGWIGKANVEESLATLKRWREEDAVKAAVEAARKAKAAASAAAASAPTTAAAPVTVAAPPPPVADARISAAGPPAGDPAPGISVAPRMDMLIALLKQGVATPANLNLMALQGILQQNIPTDGPSHQPVKVEEEQQDEEEVDNEQPLQIVEDEEALDLSMKK